MLKISWLATLASICGSFFVAFGVLLIGYVCFSLGSVSWLVVGLSRKDYPMITLNGTFFFANIVGLYRILAV